MVYVSWSVPAAGGYFRPKAPHGFKMANYRGTLVKSYLLWLVLVQPWHWPSLFGIMFFRVSPLHVDIVIDLNVKAASSNVLTVVRFTPLNYTTDAREVIDWLLFCISKLQGTSGTQTSSCWYFREGEGGDDEELPEEESAAFSEWNVFIWYKFNIATLIFVCISSRMIKINFIFRSRSVCSYWTW